ncbi:MAG: hypothetical protein JNJ62_04900 [Pseudoxanthomonas mexicana]|uniref:hypothetical protein n=1 Tax=Pseudoxanthomonas mexicana TaxID=128785 RepID=UPI0012EEBCEC|nr:hypothetical protein [Pseudoxanthomonas mexicana]MBL8255920.1 hypothetical protein [Pseudoxanthomonas mexicana]
MSVWLVDELSGQVVEIPVSARLRGALQCQWDRAERLGQRDALAARLSLALNEQLERILDADLRPPTKPQIAFAKAIAARLDVPLPLAELTSMSAVSHFIDTHSARYKAAIKKSHGSS